MSDDLGNGWALAQEWRDPADSTTAGTLWRRFSHADVADILAAATVYRQRSDALAAWNIGNFGSIGSLTICEASLSAHFEDSTYVGGCLVRTAPLRSSAAPSTRASGPWITHVRGCKLGSRLGQPKRPRAPSIGERRRPTDGPGAKVAHREARSDRPE